MKTNAPDTPHEAGIPSFFGGAVQRWVTYYAFRITGEWHTAEDAAAEVMLSLWTAYQQGKFDPQRAGSCSFAACRVRYRIYNLWRGRARQRAYLRGRTDVVHHDPAENLEAAESRAETASRYEAVVDGLKSSCTETQFRRAVTFLHGRTAGEIAASEGVGVPATRHSIEEAIFNYRKRTGQPLAGRLRIA